MTDNQNPNDGLVKAVVEGDMQAARAAIAAAESAEELEAALKAEQETHNPPSGRQIVVEAIHARRHALHAGGRNSLNMDRTEPGKIEER